MKKTLTILLLCCSLFAYTQKENNIWYFGNNAAIDFNSGTPYSTPSVTLNTDEGCATISDSVGNLLFYTDGLTVWDKNHYKMLNGDSLLGGYSSTQSALIMPFPGNEHLYYIFTVEQEGTDHHFSYSIVDMTLNGGDGDITVKNKFINAPSAEKLVAVKHANNIDYWVIIHNLANKFFCYKVNSTGFINTAVISEVGASFPNELDGLGYIKFSHDGSKLALATVWSNYIELFDFDSKTGIVSNSKFLNLPQASIGAYGLEFSPNGKYLYGTIVSPGALFQWDITSNSEVLINASRKDIFSTSIFESYGSLQLGPDKKIYLAILNSNFISEIKYPDLEGSSCNFVENSVNLGGGLSRLGLPNLIAGFYKTTTAYNFQKTDINFTISPNPFASSLSISIVKSNIKKVNILVTNILGKSEYSLNENAYSNSYSKSLDLSYLPSGIYYVSIDLDGIYYSKTIVKNK